MSDNGKILSALLIGAAAGAVLGLLMAPDKGSNTRSAIWERGEDLYDQLSDKIEEGKGALSSLKGKAKDTAVDLKNKAMSKAEQYKNDAEEEVRGIANKALQNS